MKKIERDTARIQFIDVAKGISMICIVLGHLGNPAINRVVYTFHVPIFFFITGYFISTKRNMVPFVKNKARTLIVPYIVTCLLMIILGTLSGIWNGEGMRESALKWIFASVYGAGDSYTDPFVIQKIGPVWFLWATFWGSIFLRLSLQMKVVVRQIFIAALFILFYLSTNLFWFPLSIQAGACATLFMYMGYLLRQAGGKLKMLSGEIKICGACFSIIIWISFIKSFHSFWLVHCDFGYGIIDIFRCICACAIVVLFSWFVSRKLQRASRALGFLGRYSLIMLCIHNLEQNLFPWKNVYAELEAHGISSPIQLLLVIFCKLTLTIFITWICSKSRIVRKIFAIKQ